MGLTILNLGSPDFSYRMRENLDIPEEELLSKRLGNTMQISPSFTDMEHNVKSQRVARQCFSDRAIE